MIKHLKQLTLAGLTSAVALGMTACSDSSSPSNVKSDNSSVEKKVLVVGIDGLMYDYIDDIDTPNMDEPTLTHMPELSLSRALVGGYLGTQTYQASSSGPSWSSILTGQWVDGHGIPSNNNAPVKSKSIFEHLRAADNDIEMGSFAAWNDINKGHMAISLVDAGVSKQVSGSPRPAGVSVDDYITDKLVTELSDADSELDFIFAHLDEIDYAGHNCGWCELYENKLLATDQRMGQILDAIENREANFNEEWLVMIVSDHGHLQAGGHGGDTIEERTGVIGTTRPDLMNALFTAPKDDANFSADPAQNKLMSYPGISAITPTVMDYFGFTPKAEDSFSSPSLISEPGVTKAFTKVEQDDSDSATVTLTWRAADNVKTVNIMRDGQEVAQLDATLGEYKDTFTIANEGAGKQLKKYTLVPDAGNSYTTWSRFELEEAAVLADVLASITEVESFNGTAGNFTFQAEGNNTVEFEQGPFSGNAVRVNRDKGYLSKALSFDAKAEGTIGFWLKVNGTVTSDPNVIANKDWDSGVNPGFTLSIKDTSMKFNVGDGNNRGDAGLSEYTKDEWLFVAITWNLNAKEVALYVHDPVLGFRKSLAETDVTSLATNFPLNIGEGGDGDYNVGATIDFTMADLVMFDRAIRSSEAKVLAESNARIVKTN